ncbi:MAG: glycosyltransferase, partial [Bryobacteraceae bacterium]|nr:glycosyltransferase [Bryobacteraceae bacterium]
ACGVVPIATNAGGVPDLVTHGEDGFLEAVGDVDSQAARVVELFRDETKLLRMSGAARDTAVSRFSAERLIPLYEAHYEKVLRSA